MTDLETPSQRASRKWSNNFKQMQWKKAQKEEAERAAKEADEQPPSFGEVLKNDKIIKGSVLRAQTKFAKDIREMLEGHTHRNLVEYKRALQARIHRLKLEKYKRLKARHDALEAAQEAQAATPAAKVTSKKGLVLMINLNREIRPEDFAHDPERVWWTDDPTQREAKRRYEAELRELERLYHMQEEAKAKARFKAEQAIKDAIPFSEALALEICHRVSAGEFVNNICKEPDMPTVRSVTMWKKEHHDFKLLYDEAVSDRLDIFEDEVVTIADDSSADTKTVTKAGKQVKVTDGEVISRAKLRVDVRKACLKAFRPERWGEQSTINVNNYDAMDPANMSEEELEKGLADLETKSEVVKAA